MKPMYIELLVDRLCGLFPKDNIARNTVKKTWLHDDYLLLSVQETEVSAALAVLECDKFFPTLHRVKEVFRANVKKGIQEQNTPACDVCGGTGWDSGDRWEDTPGGYVMTKERLTTVGPLGDTTTYVIRCESCLV